MQRGNTRTKGLALEARRAAESGTPRRAMTTSPASEPRSPTDEESKEGKEGRRAKGANKTWVTFSFRRHDTLQRLWQWTPLLLLFLLDRSVLGSPYAGRWSLARKRQHRRRLKLDFNLTHWLDLSRRPFSLLNPARGRPARVGLCFGVCSWVTSSGFTLTWHVEEMRLRPPFEF